mmetsp:Transcript_23252/g.37370  ORF Transcript_23252/g.37370 Transcript_23252/m.37370 type:complete len:232 (-) Transcript_23252:1146-1841(-)
MPRRPFLLRVYTSVQGHLRHCAKRDLHHCAKRDLSHCAKRDLHRCVERDQHGEGLLSACRRRSTRPILLHVQTRVQRDLHQCTKRDLCHCAKGDLHSCVEKDLHSCVERDLYGEGLLFACCRRITRRWCVRFLLLRLRAVLRHRARLRRLRIFWCTRLYTSIVVTLLVDTKAVGQVASSQLLLKHGIELLPLLRSHVVAPVSHSPFWRENLRETSFSVHPCVAVFPKSHIT